MTGWRDWRVNIWLNVRSLRPRATTSASSPTLVSQFAFYRMIDASFRSFALLLAHISQGCTAFSVPPCAFVLLWVWMPWLVWRLPYSFWTSISTKGRIWETITLFSAIPKTNHCFWFSVTLCSADLWIQ